MCMFVGEIERVSSTRIFASRGADGRQQIVYSMDLDTRSEVAMVLPLPVVPGSGDDALRFIDLSGYADFFDDLARFYLASRAGGDDDDGMVSFDEAPPLVVHQVGAFEASYVPSHADWGRLDPRFRFDGVVWNELRVYDDFGFAVFQLSPCADLGTQRVHPMAFAFESRTPEQFFFPTIHVHDGQVHEVAEFDHDLYCQLPAGHPLLESFAPLALHGTPDARTWTRSPGKAGVFVNAERALGLINGNTPIHMCQIHGAFANQDVLVATDG